MAETALTFGSVTRLIGRYRGLILPVGAAMMIIVVLVPLPAVVMDVLLAANIALAAVILLTAIAVSSPLEFSVFPSVLLGATLLRLVLNIASTRLILTAGKDGAGIAQAGLAAGHVIWSFSHMVTSGSLAVGVILFAMIAIIQFVVITKGAGRISEVAARFVLDAMPGKQMAIDADLSAGSIDESAARRRRKQIASEADFYGAMDGASKFVRGDAIAAVIITLVNIFGGLYMGLVQRGWSLVQTLELFTRLTIGDGLVTQIPALLVSVSAALIVSRTMARTDFSKQVIKQLTSKPAALAVTSIFLAALMFTALPTLPLLAMSVGCGVMAFVLSRKRPGRSQAEVEEIPQVSSGAADIKVRELLAVDPMRMDVGFALIDLVDSRKGGEMLKRITALRRQVAIELGLVIPPIRVTDDMRLKSHQYVIKIRGAKVAEGRSYPNQLLAIPKDNATGELTGRRITEPAFGGSAVWITPDQRSRAESMNYTVVGPTVAIMTHLTETIRAHAPRLLSRQQVVAMLDLLAENAEALVREVREKVPLSKIRKVLQRLLAERVSVRDMETILEYLIEQVPQGGNVETLTEGVRQTLSPSIRINSVASVRIDK